jgi:hypothetical protein
MYKKSRILIPIFTTFIVLSFLISLAYGIKYNSDIDDKSTSLIYIKKMFLIISSLLIILLTIFNFYILFINLNYKPNRFIV